MVPLLPFYFITTAESKDVEEKAEKRSVWTNIESKRWYIWTTISQEPILKSYLLFSPISSVGNRVIAGKC